MKIDSQSIEIRGRFGCGLMPFHLYIIVLDPERFEQGRWLSSRQITDAYLLALAVSRGGMFVTLDRELDRALIREAQPHHLIVI